LLYISGKSLGAEFHSFDHGEVREELIGQFPDGHPVPNGKNRRLNDFSTFSRQHLCTQ